MCTESGLAWALEYRLAVGLRVWARDKGRCRGIVACVCTDPAGWPASAPFSAPALARPPPHGPTPPGPSVVTTSIR